MCQGAPGSPQQPQGPIGRYPSPMPYQGSGGFVGPSRASLDSQAPSPKDIQAGGFGPVGTAPGAGQGSQPTGGFMGGQRGYPGARMSTPSYDYAPGHAPWEQGGSLPTGGFMGGQPGYGYGPQGKNQWDQGGSMQAGGFMGGQNRSPWAQAGGMQGMQDMAQQGGYQMPSSEQIQQFSKANPGMAQDIAHMGAMNPDGSININAYAELAHQTGIGQQNMQETMQPAVNSNPNQPKATLNDPMFNFKDSGGPPYLSPITAMTSAYAHPNWNMNAPRGPGDWFNTQTNSWGPYPGR